MEEKDDRDRVEQKTREIELDMECEPAKDRNIKGHIVSK